MGVPVTLCGLSTCWGATPPFLGLLQLPPIGKILRLLFELLQLPLVGEIPFLLLGREQTEAQGKGQKDQEAICYILSEMVSVFSKTICLETSQKVFIYSFYRKYLFTKFQKNIMSAMICKHLTKFFVALNIMPLSNLFHISSILSPLSIFFLLMYSSINLIPKNRLMFVS